MNAKDAIKLSIDMGQMISLGYLKDLTDKELLHRPAKVRITSTGSSAT